MTFDHCSTEWPRMDQITLTEARNHYGLRKEDGKWGVIRQQEGGFQSVLRPPT